MSTDEATKVADVDALVDAVSSNEDVELTEPTVEEIWRVWDAWLENHPHYVLVIVPDWFASNDFGARRPVFFAMVEHDDPEKGAILFDNAQLVDISIVENQVFDGDMVTLDDTLETLDMSEDNDYIDDPGLVWIPRSLMSVYDRE